MFYNLSEVYNNYILFIKTKVILYIDFSVNINCDNYSVAPSIINLNLKNVLFH